MAENKIQHFVPQFLLRNFSVNQEQTHIALFNIRKEKFVSKTEIRTQAEKKYYYGDDGEVEKLLSMIEDRTAPIIKKMIEKNELPEVYSKGHYNLITFIMTMIGRTKYMGDTVLEIANKLLNQTMLDSPNDEEIKKPFRENKIRINHKYPVLFSLTSSLQNRAIFWDLKFKLLENTTKQPFIISDNPVVLYNQVLEKKRKFANNVGYATPGLEIFMPISPLKCIYFYDETFYNVGSKSKRTVCIKEEKDAESLNKLQLLNGNENVFFTNSITESYIHNLFNKSKKLRRLDKTNLVSQIDRKKEAPNNHSYMFTMNEIRTLLTLSFVFETQKAQNFDACSNPLLIRNLELFKKATRKIENFENRA